MLERERKSVVIAEQAGAGVGHPGHPGHPVVQRKTGSCYCRASTSYEQPLARQRAAAGDEAPQKIQSCCFLL